MSGWERWNKLHQRVGVMKQNRLEGEKDINNLALEGERDMKK